MLQKLEITNEFNQRISTTIDVDGALLDVEILLQYNRMAGYWTATIKRSATNEVLISSMPLLAKQNLLGQYGHLLIGSSEIVNLGRLSDDAIDDANFGTDFVWCWDDTI